MGKLLTILSFLLLLSIPAVYSQELTFRSLDVQDGLPGNFWAEDVIQDSRGFIWIGSKSGLVRYDGHDLCLFSPNADDPFSPISRDIQKIHENKSGSLWLGSVGSGIEYYDPSTGYFQKLQLPGTSSLRVWDYFETDTKMWIATEGNGLAELDLVDTTISFHRPTLTETDFFQTFRFIQPDPYDSLRLWLGSRAGLLTFNIDSRQFETHPMPYKSPMELDYMCMHGIFDDDLIWLGTYWGGLLSFNTTTLEWNQYTFNAQFPSKDPDFFDVVNEVLSYDDNTLLLATYSGLLLFDKRDGTFLEFTAGPLGSRMYSGLLRTRQKNIFSVGVGPAISICVPPHEDSELLLSKPYITQVFVDGIQQAGYSASGLLPPLSMANHQRDLAIEFVSPQVSSPESVQYSYQLEGQDRHWVNSEQRRYISYTNLTGGRYQFRYRASLDGVHWIEGTPFAITQHIPFWRHPLFIVGVGLFLLTVVGIIVHLRIQSIRKQAALTNAFNQRIMEVELSALRAQMNPHFMFNSLNSIKYYILKNQNDEANKYLTKFSQLMRSVLKDSKSKLISLADELHALRLYIELEALRFTEIGFDFHLDVADEVDPETLYLPPLVVQPYVENAIWHGLLHKKSPGTLWVRINKNGQTLFIEIEDDGIGREAAQRKKSKSATKNKSYGMQITSDRIELVKATFGIDSSVTVLDLYDQHGVPSGTKVTLDVPLITEEDYERILESSNP